MKPFSGNALRGAAISVCLALAAGCSSSDSADRMKCRVVAYFDPDQTAAINARIGIFAKKNDIFWQRSANSMDVFYDGLLVRRQRYMETLGNNPYMRGYNIFILDSRKAPDPDRTVQIATQLIQDVNTVRGVQAEPMSESPDPSFRTRESECVLAP